MSVLTFDVILVVCVVALQSCLANLRCYSSAGGWSGTGDGDTAYRACTQVSGWFDYTLTGCGIEARTANNGGVDGVIMEIDFDFSNRRRCVAMNGVSGAGVRPWIRCCDFTDVGDIVSAPLGDQRHDGTDGSFLFQANGDDNPVTAPCSQTGYEYVTWCGVWSPWKEFDGAYPGTIHPGSSNPQQYTAFTDYPLTVQQCTAQNGGSAHSYGTATCVNSPTYALSCVTRYSAKVTASGQPALAAVSCSSDYTMVGCSPWSWYAQVNTHYIGTDDVCRVYTSNGAEVVAIAICCKLETESPTSDPTTSPTDRPTESPTKKPTQSPTEDPTRDPTRDPTTDPTRDPTTDPTADPTRDPTADPTTDPTWKPSTSPTSAPSQSPTMAPSDAPTFSPTRAPTPFCPNLRITIGGTGPYQFDPLAFEGLYVYQHNLGHGGRPVFYVGDGTDKKIEYSGIAPGGFWEIFGVGTGKLSFGPDGGLYPPYGAESGPWTHIDVAVTDPVRLTVKCVSTFAPIAAPTSAPTFSPTVAPTFSPTRAPTDAPTEQPTSAPTVAPTGSPSQPPTNAPTFSPTRAPTMSPTASPTSFCRTLQIAVDNPYSDTQWDGLYHLDEGNPSFALSDWVGIGDADGAFLKYVGGFWVIFGRDAQTLTHKERNDVDNYPPIGDAQWNFEAELIEQFTVHINCSDTFTPSALPTKAPTRLPTAAPTQFVFGLFIEDDSGDEILFDNWFYERDNSTSVDAQGPPRFFYSDGTYFSDLEYDTTLGWQIELQFSTVDDTDRVTRTYSSDRHGANPPLNEWVLFTAVNRSAQFFLTPMLTLRPTAIPSVSPVVAPTVLTTLAPTFAPTLPPSHAPSSAPSATPSHAPTSFPTVVCEVLTVHVPQAFTDGIARRILQAPFLYQGVTQSSMSPFWSIDCHALSANEHANCDNAGNDDVTGSIYFDGTAWLISIHSQSADYYKLYATAATQSSMRMIPLNGATWRDLDTNDGMTAPSYVFEIVCEALQTSTPSNGADADAQQKQTSSRAYIYDETWFWLAIILFIVFAFLMGGFCVWWNKKRKQKPKIVNFDAAPVVAMNQRVAQYRGEQFSPAAARAASLGVPKVSTNYKTGGRHTSVPTGSQQGQYTPNSSSANPLVSDHSPQPGDSRGTQSVVGYDGAGFDWNDEDPKKVFNV